MAGASSDQKLAAIMTPAAKPSIASSSLRLTVLKKKTTAAPRAVTPQVKQRGQQGLLDRMHVDEPVGHGSLLVRGIGVRSAPQHDPHGPGLPAIPGFER